MTWVTTWDIDCGDGVFIGDQSGLHPSIKIMTCSTFAPESLDAELSLTELQSMSGGVAPAAVILAGFLAAAAYGAYKYHKEMDKVPQPSESDDINKLSYCGDVKKQEDPFGGTFTGKAN